MGLGIEAKSDIHHKFAHDKPISIELDPPFTENPPLLRIKQEGKQPIITTDFYFTNIKPSDLIIPPPHISNDHPSSREAAASDPPTFQVDPTQEGEVRLHSWHLYTSQAPVLDLTNRSVTNTTGFLQAFDDLNLCLDSYNQSTHGRKTAGKE